MRLAGLIEVCRDCDTWIEQVLGSLSEQVDVLCVYANGVTSDRIRAACQAQRNLAVYHEVPYHPYGTEYSAEAVALLRDIRPDYYVFPTADELLPANFDALIGMMDAADALSVRIPALVCVGNSTDRVVADVALHAGQHLPHHRIARWMPSIASHGPFNAPSPEHEQRSILSPWPMRHLYVSTPRLWRERYMAKPQPWMLTQWPTAPYDPAKTWKQWMGMGTGSISVR